VRCNQTIHSEGGGNSERKALIPDPDQNTTKERDLREKTVVSYLFANEREGFYWGTQCKTTAKKELNL